MSAPSPSRQNVVILVILLALQLFLMSDTARSHGTAAWCESVAMRLSSPAVIVAEAVAGGLRGGLSGARDLLAAHARNTALEAQIRRLQDDLVRHREAGPENRRLRRLLSMRETLASEAIAASLVTATLDGRTRTIVVDRGTRHGVAVDLPVVAWGGAVGRVIAVNRGHAKIRLLDDASSGVAGVVQRSRAQGIVEGRAERTLHMLYVPGYADVIHGDRVVTSGLDGIFPRGFGIGTVTSIEESPDGTRTILLEPELNYGSLEEVLILLEPGAGADEPSSVSDVASPS